MKIVIFSCGEAQLNKWRMASVCLSVTQKFVPAITQKRVLGIERPFH